MEIYILICQWVAKILLLLISSNDIIDLVARVASHMRWGRAWLCEPVASVELDRCFFIYYERGDSYADIIFLYSWRSWKIQG